MAAQNLNNHIAPPPIPQQSTYYLAINGQQSGPFDVATITSYVNGGQVTKDTLAWKQGMPTWAALGSIPEFSCLFAPCPPPIPPTL